MPPLNEFYDIELPGTELAELRNQLIVTRWLTSHVLQPSSKDLSLTEIKVLHKILLKDTNAENIDMLKSVLVNTALFRYNRVVIGIQLTLTQRKSLD